MNNPGTDGTFSSFRQNPGTDGMFSSFNDAKPGNPVTDGTFPSFNDAKPENVPSVTGLEGAGVLQRRRRLFAQGAGRMQREIGIAQEFAPQQNQVGLPVAHDIVGLPRRGDQADGTGTHLRLAPDALGKPDLISGPKRDLRIWR